MVVEGNHRHQAEEGSPREQGAEAEGTRGLEGSLVVQQVAWRKMGGPGGSPPLLGGREDSLDRTSAASENW